MTEYEILILGCLMLEEFGVDRHWKLRLVDGIPIPGGKDLAGHTSWDRRQIDLSRRYVLHYPPERVRQVIEHEIAHVFTPEDWTHGEIFTARLETMRGTRNPHSVVHSADGHE